MLVGAKKIGRPVHWMSGRNESFVSDNHARDAYSDVELALDDKGKFLALPASAISAAWAPTSARSAPTSRPPT